MKNPFEKLERKYEKMRRQRDEARAELLKLREPSEEYEVKEMHIDCEKKDFEVGKWYKTRDGLFRSRFTEKGSFNSGCVIFDWKNNIPMTDFSLWRLATPEEIKEVLTKRCKELGLFDGEFTGFIDYWEEYDQLWIGKNLAYEKGKFAELVDNKTK